MGLCSLYACSISCLPRITREEKLQTSIAARWSMHPHVISAKSMHGGVINDLTNFPVPFFGVGTSEPIVSKVEPNLGRTYRVGPCLFYMSDTYCSVSRRSRATQKRRLQRVENRGQTSHFSPPPRCKNKERDGRNFCVNFCQFFIPVLSLSNGFLCVRMGGHY